VAIADLVLVSLAAQRIHVWVIDYAGAVTGLARGPQNSQVVGKLQCTPAISFLKEFSPGYTSDRTVEVWRYGSQRFA